MVARLLLLALLQLLLGRQTVATVKPLRGGGRKCCTWPFMPEEVSLRMSPANTPAFKSDDDDDDDDLATQIYKLRQARQATGAKQHPLAVIQLAVGSIHRLQTPLKLQGRLDSNLVIDGGSIAQINSGMLQHHSQPLPRVSSGKKLTGWSSVMVNGIEMWTTQTNASEPFSKLFAEQRNGTSAEIPRVRVPSSLDSYLQWDVALAPCTSGSCPDEDKMGFRYKEGSLKDDWDLSDAVAQVFASWSAQWRTIAAIDHANRSLFFREPMSYAVGSTVSNSGKRYAVENVYPPLAPGQWHRSGSGVVTYWPHPEDDIKSFAPIAPRHSSAIILAGVSNVTIRSLALMHGSDGGDRNLGTAERPALINITAGSTDIQILGVEITATGAGGVSVNGGARRVKVNSSWLHHLGSAGVSAAATKADELRMEYTADVSVANSVISNTNQVFLDGAGGVVLIDTHRGTVSNCDISFSPYAGILANAKPSQRGGFGSHRFVNNYIHQYGFLLSDLGGIYLGGDLQGQNRTQGAPAKFAFSAHTVIANNIVQHSHFFTHGGNGIYLDGGVGGVHVSQNILANLSSAALYIHCGVNITVENNIAAFSNLRDASLAAVGAGGSAVMGCDAGGYWRSGPNPAFSLNMRRNIVATGAGPLLMGMNFRTSNFNENVYTTTSNGNLSFGAVFLDSCFDWRAGHNNCHQRDANATTFAEWTRLGQDRLSRITEPEQVFQHLPNNLLPRPTSVATKLGFEPIDVGTVGVSRDTFLARLRLPLTAYDRYPFRAVI